VPVVVKGSLVKRLQVAAAGIPERDRRVAQRASRRLAELAREFCPVDEDGEHPGQLLDSIRALRVRRTREGYLGGAAAEAEYASYVEWDTRAHEIRPRLRRALRFTIEGRDVFAARVMHPGTRGAHFMARAAARLEEEIDRIGEEETVRWLREAGL
jgi:hypothetical protein